MNPLTNMKNIKKLSEQELHMNLKTSWHDQYKDSAWIFVGGLPYDLSEGDVICIFSQYGEIVNINLIRDKDTGKSKGFCFICYEDQRSTVLAVDNFNGTKVLGRILRVDHVSEYKVPKEGKKTDEETKRLYREGCAPDTLPQVKQEIRPVKVEPDDIRETLADQISGEIRLPQRLPIYPIKQEKLDDDEVKVKKEKKKKKDKKKKKKKEKSKKKKKSHNSDNSSDEDSSSDSSVRYDSSKSKRNERPDSGSKSKKRYQSSSSDDDSDREKYKKRKDSEIIEDRKHRKHRRSPENEVSDQEYTKNKKREHEKDKDSRKERYDSDDDRKEYYRKRSKESEPRSHCGKEHKRSRK